MNIFNFFNKKATKKNEGEIREIIWEMDKKIYRRGIIENVDDNGFFDLKFEGGAYMVCRNLNNMRKINTSE